MLDSISLGNAFHLNANVNPVAGSSLFEKSPEADISHALYGQFSGLLVKNSSSTYDSNQAKLKLSLRPVTWKTLPEWKLTRSLSSRTPPPLRSMA